MLGHCPGAVRIERLLQLPEALEEMRSCGFGQRVDRLASGSDLHHLPIPLRSIAEFDDIFPEARNTDTTYQSELAGKRAWLPQSVEDFFSNGGEKCWLIQVPEADGVNGFLPQHKVPLYDTDNLLGLSCALVLNRVGLIVLPDLERLQIPQNLQGIPRKRLPNPSPAFIPCTGEVADDGHRERRISSEIPLHTEPLPFVQLLQKILEFSVRYRPDIQYIFSLPLAYTPQQGGPVVDGHAVTAVDAARKLPGAHLLRQVQLIFPYIKDVQGNLRSASGLLAGTIGRSARQRGIWRSVAGLNFNVTAQPFPAISMAQTLGLRETPGVGVINRRGGILLLDDERLTVPALHRDDYIPGDYGERLNSTRSGEVVRFMGFLVRQLRALGERIIFNIGYQDPRPRLLLEKFFMGLFRAGALRGTLPEQAFSIRQYDLQEAVVAFDIEVAPAYPIDKIILTFVNRDGQWYAEASGG
jgi:hypothetical protein